MLGEVGGELDVVRDDEIAVGTVGLLVTFSSQSDLCTVLRFGLYLQLEFSALCLQQDFTTEQCSVHVDAHRGLHVVVSLVHVHAAPCAMHTTTEEIFEEGREPSGTTKLAEVEAVGIAATVVSATVLSGIASSFLECIGLLPLLAVLVVLLPLLRVGEYGVGFIQCLELGFGLRVVGVKVRMKLPCPLGIRLSDFTLRSVLGDTHDFVVVYECHIVSVLLFRILSILFETKSIPNHLLIVKIYTNQGCLIFFQNKTLEVSIKTRKFAV